MSTINLATLQSNTALPPTIQNSSAVEIGTFCRAWVNFNGTGTVAIRASFNVSSITDNGVGTYTLNFTTAMQDRNYSFNGLSWNPGSTAAITGVDALLSSYVTLSSFNTSGTTRIDVPEINVAIFR